MLFNSLSYLFFLFLVIFLFWIVFKSHKIYFLVLASFIFYGFWEPIYLLLIISISIADYFIALKISRSREKKIKKIYLISSIVLNISLLIIFKYLYFFTTNLQYIGFNIDPNNFNFILPLGISFFTFEAISYNVDVYRNHFLPEKNYIYYFCFISFFPKLIAGPILRAKDLIPQFKSLQFSWKNFNIGLRRIIIGLFLKVVIADNISGFVDDGFLIPNNLLNPLDIWTLSFLFGIQIYFDFSAYSSIAIGSARLFGIVISENFNFPYLSRNPKEFWNKWHISLSSWIKDYLYVPLVKYYERRKFITFPLFNFIRNNNFSLVITWVIMGFWHGANWTFILWGLIHSILILFYRFTTKFIDYNSNTFLKIFSHFFTLSIVMLAWISFRSVDLLDAIHKYQLLFSFNDYLKLGLRENVYLITFVLMLSIYFFSFTRKYYYFSENSNLNYIINFLIGLILIPLILGFLKPTNQFIYFQF